MTRKETQIMKGWKFCIKNEEPLVEEYNEVVLPHDWSISAPFSQTMPQARHLGFRERFDLGWYTRTLVLDEKCENRSYYLDFGGIFENSTIWLNGKEVGGNKYGYSSFSIDITEAIKSGENTILIKVDNTVGPADRWYSGCGIYRTVKFIAVNKNHFDERDIVVNTEINNKDAIVKVHTNKNEEVKAIIRQKGIAYKFAENKIVGESVGKEVITIDLKNIELWSAENPYLYELELQLFDGENILDSIKMNIGLREVIFKANEGMFVNGKPTKLMGVCLHQDVGSRGIAAKKEVWAERLKSLKEMGCNSVRAAHHTHSSEFMDLCDEMGFYVYEESFDKWTAGLYGRYFETEWQKDIDAMVKRDRNRPSVVIWGVGNEVENQAQDSMIPLLKMLYDYTKSIDDTRPITYAMNPHYKRESKRDLSLVDDIQQFVDFEDDTEIYNNKERIERICRIGEIVDIISCNYQEQWYDLIHEAMPDKLILGTEVYQFFRGSEHKFDNFSLENPSLIIEEQDYYIGSMIWSGYDYLGEALRYPAKGWCGAVIRTNGERRPSYYILQSYWSEEPMVHISVMDQYLQDEISREHWYLPKYADHWHFPQFNSSVIPYMIATNCDEVTLHLNNTTYYVKKPTECESRLITGYIPWEAGTVKVVGYKNGEAVCEHKLVTPSIAVKLEFDSINPVVPYEEDYEMLLTVRAKDIEGNIYQRESAITRFIIEGDAEIIAVDNGNLMSNEPYTGDSIHMYHGVANVMIRLKGDSGRIKVMAVAEGMDIGEIVINLK